MNIIYLRQQAQLSPESLDEKTGKFKGVAYTGAVIKQHGWIKNLIIDLSTLTVQKKRTPVLRDHTPSQVAGSGVVTVSDKEVLIEGTLSKKSIYGKEIIDLSEDVDWEMSLGIFDGNMREFENETINGVHLTSGTVLENGIIRETTFTVLGADMETSAEVFNVKKKESENMKLQQHDSWAKFACACGGKKDSTPEDLEAKFAENTEEIDKLKSEIETLKSEIAKKQAEIDELEEQGEAEDREENLKAAAKEKGLKLSESSIKEAAKSKESSELMLSFIKGAEKEKTLIDKKFTKDVELSDEDNSSGKLIVEDDSKAIRLAANKLIKDGKAKNFKEAMDLIEIKGKD